MDIILKSVRIINPGTTHHQKTRDIIIVNGKIKSITTNAGNEEGIKELDLKGCYVMPGWFDMRANFREPGEEHKEDLGSGIKAAAAGGFTEVLLMPSTLYPIQSKSDTEFILNKCRNSMVNVHVAGCLTTDRKGIDMAELYEMYVSGAIAFTDDKKVNDPGMLVRALQYSNTFGARIISYADEPSLSNNYLINESPSSVRTGMKGCPAVAEEIGLNRIIRIAEYTGIPVHISGISTAGSVVQIRNAKSKGIKITAEVNAHNLMLDETLVESFDSKYKVKPVLRSRTDIQALKKGITDGVIDCVCSDHSPQDIEVKNCEYDYAAHGISSIETTFATLSTAFKGQLDAEILFNIFSGNPRKILGLEIPSINEAETANMTVYHPDKTSIFSEKEMFSKSKNTPFHATEFIGKVIGVINNNKLSGF